MSLPVLLHSGMTGAPSMTPANGTINALLNACLVNGFNTQSVSSATCTSGVVAFNFPSAPGFSTSDTVTIAGASNTTVNGQFRVQSAASNQVLVATPGVPDGAVGGTITLKFSPLGWTRPYSGTNLGAYRQGGSASHKRYLRVYDGSTTADSSYYVRAYEAMTAISTGTGPFPTTAQSAGNGVAQFGAQAAVQSWCIVGTPRFFYLFIGYGVDATGALTALPKGSTASFFFGEPADVQKAADVYACALPGSAYAWGSSAYMSRSYLGTGTSTMSVSVVGPGAASATSLSAPYPDPGSGHLLVLGPAILLDTSSSTSVRGFLPGFLCMANSPIGAGPAFPGDKVSDVTGVTGRLMFVNWYGASSNGDAALLLDEDWGDT
jgi:hypothetical protein